MPQTFVAQVANPSQAFSRLKRWADGNGYALHGSPSGGQFRGKPAGIAGVLIGEISGTYAVDGNLVTIQVDKDLPKGAVASALSQHGLKVVKAY